MGVLLQIYYILSEHLFIRTITESCFCSNISLCFSVAEHFKYWKYWYKMIYKDVLLKAIRILCLLKHWDITLNRCVAGTDLPSEAVVQMCSIRQVLQNSQRNNCANVSFFKPNQDWGAQKSFPISFSPVTSTKVGISPQNILTFLILLPLVLILLPHWCKISRPCLMPVPNYWTRTKSTRQKNWSNQVFLIKSL